MTDNEAKEILRAYRPGISPEVPSIAAAIKHINGKPEREEWFEQELARDQAIADKLNDAPVPEGLLESILEGAPSQKPKNVVHWKSGGCMSM